MPSHLHSPCPGLLARVLQPRNSCAHNTYSRRSTSWGNLARYSIGVAHAEPDTKEASVNAMVLKCPNLLQTISCSEKLCQRGAVSSSSLHRRCCSSMLRMQDDGLAEGVRRRTACSRLDLGRATRAAQLARACACSCGTRRGHSTSSHSRSRHRSGGILRYCWCSHHCSLLCTHMLHLLRRASEHFCHHHAAVILQVPEADVASEGGIVEHVRHVRNRRNSH